MTATPLFSHWYREIELWLDPSPELTKKYGKIINKAGGKYTKVTKTSDTRYVTLPSTERQLIHTLANEFPLRENRPEIGEYAVLRSPTDAFRESTVFCDSRKNFGTRFNRHAVLFDLDALTNAYQDKHKGNDVGRICFQVSCFDEVEEVKVVSTKLNDKQDLVFLPAGQYHFKRLHSDRASAEHALRKQLAGKIVEHQDIIKALEAKMANLVENQKEKFDTIEV